MNTKFLKKITALFLSVLVIVLAFSVLSSADEPVPAFEEMSFTDESGKEQASKVLIENLGKMLCEAYLSDAESGSESRFEKYELIPLFCGNRTNDSCNGCFADKEGNWHKYLRISPELSDLTKQFFGTASRMVITEAIKSTADWSDPYDQVNALLNSAVKLYAENVKSTSAESEIKALEAVSIAGGADIFKGEVPSVMTDYFHTVFFWEHYGNPFGSFRANGGYTFFNPTDKTYSDKDEALSDIGDSFIHFVVYDFDKEISEEEILVSYPSHRTNEDDHWYYAFADEISVKTKNADIASTCGNGDYDDYKAMMDGDKSTQWNADIDGLACFNWKTDVPAVLSVLKIYCKDSSVTFAVEGSTGDGTWQNIGYIPANNSECAELKLDNDKAFGNYRIFFIGSDEETNITVSEIETIYGGSSTPTDSTSVKNIVPVYEQNEEQEAQTLIFRIIERIISFFKKLFGFLQF